ncbi:MAG: hypothetical protein RIB84_09490 [Sneathiellaceae bacterium]
MTDSDKQTAGRNQGEGDRESARRYNKHSREFQAENDAAAKARDAAKALSGDEGKDLRKAEAEGKAKARGEDPQVHRDR